MHDTDWIESHHAVRRPGLLFGVCHWTADRLGLAPCWVRLAVLVAAWLSDWWPAAAIYLAVAILLGRARPARVPAVADWRLPTGFTSFAPADLGGRCRRLERRLRDVETRLRRERNWDELLRRPV
jgi:phage shock protein PspC (stress-responsive transcriptional regulator)